MNDARPAEDIEAMIDASGDRRALAPLAVSLRGSRFAAAGVLAN